MRILAFEAGMLLSRVVNRLAKEHFVNPTIKLFKDDKSYIMQINDKYLTSSIPKAIDIIENNTENALSAILIYPAELENDDKTRQKALIVDIRDFETGEYLYLAQHYDFDDFTLKIKEYELLYDNVINSELEELEQEFVKGVINKNKKPIWA